MFFHAVHHIVSHSAGSKIQNTEHGPLRNRKKHYFDVLVFIETALPTKLLNSLNSLNVPYSWPVTLTVEAVTVYQFYNLWCISLEGNSSVQWLNLILSIPPHILIT